MKYLIIGLFQFFYTQSLLAAWASGGGAIHRDGHNPWFLENTQTVRYCIDIDEENFGVSSEEASKQVASALTDWTSNLRLANYDYYRPNELIPFGQVRLGTQNFVEVSCAESQGVDLRFQLGRLTASQESKFNNPKDFIGIAVRTDYDVAQLKGSGFIYLAPVSGQLAPNHKRMHPSAWSQHHFLALKIILRHELGHVFGIDHQPESLMDDKWPELFVEKNFLNNLSMNDADRFLRKYQIARIFGLQKDFEAVGCGSRNPVFCPGCFGEQYSEQSCGRVELKNQALKIHYKKPQTANFELIGTSNLDSKHSQSSAAVSLYIPENQRVFTGLPEEAKRVGRLFGVRKNTSVKMNGDLTIERTGDKFPLLIELMPTSTATTVINRGHFNFDVFFLD